jgi:hypothetical protein
VRLQIPWGKQEIYCFANRAIGPRELKQQVTCVSAPRTSLAWVAGAVVPSPLLLKNLSRTRERWQIRKSDNEKTGIATERRSETLISKSNDKVSKITDRFQASAINLFEGLFHRLACLSSENWSIPSGGRP